MADRQIRVLPSFSGYKEGAICFETRCSPEQVNDLSLYAFEHHGEGFTAFSPSALRLLYERMLLGQAMPSVLILTDWWKYDQLMAAALFSYPQIVLDTDCTSLVNSIDLVDRLGPPAFGHIPYDHKELVYMLRQVTSPYQNNQVSSQEVLRTLGQCASLIASYVLDGTLPPVESPVPDYEVIDEVGSFVAFEAQDYVWDDLYSEGYLCGIWFCPGKGVYVSKKSPLVSSLDMNRVAARLNELESGGPEKGWEAGLDAVQPPDKLTLDRETVVNAVKSLLEFG